MSLRRSTRHGRTLRSSRFSELTAFQSENNSNSGADSDSDFDTDDLDEIINSNSSDENEEPVIPQVEMQDIINMATEILENSDNPTSQSLRNMRFRMRSGDIDIARQLLVDQQQQRQQQQQPAANLVDRLNGRQRRVIDERPIWMRIVDSITITLFPIVLLRGLKNVLSASSFSIDILQDTFDFIDYVQVQSKNVVSTVIEAYTSYPSTITSGPVNSDNLLENVSIVANSMIPQPKTSSLLMKFGEIIIDEFPNLNDNIKITLSLIVFYVYTILFSIFMVSSFAFLSLCLVCSVGKRWNSIEVFISRLFKDGQGCF